MNSSAAKPRRISVLAFQTSCHSQPVSSTLECAQASPFFLSFYFFFLQGLRLTAGAVNGSMCSGFPGGVGGWGEVVEGDKDKPDQILLGFIGLCLRSSLTATNRRGSSQQPLPGPRPPRILLGEVSHAENIHPPHHSAVPFRTFHRLVVQSSSAVASTTRIKVAGD